MSFNRGLFSSARLDWASPADVFEALDKEFHFGLDVCATAETAKCQRYFTKADDALIRDWAGERCYMNPPYGREIGGWIRKAFEESLKGVLVVCLIPSRTDTAWWHDYVMRADEIRFVRGRIHFDGHKHGVPFPSAIVVYEARALQSVAKIGR